MFFLRARVLRSPTDIGTMKSQLWCLANDNCVVDLVLCGRLDDSGPG